MLDQGLVLDHLTDDEIDTCVVVGLLHAPSPYPMLDPGFGVGFRYTREEPSRVGRAGRSHDGDEEGSFGRRPLSSESRLVDDVLSALRLHSRTVLVSGKRDRAGCMVLRARRNFLSRPVTPSFGASGPLPHSSRTSRPGPARQLVALTGGSSRQVKGSRSINVALRRFSFSFDRERLDDRLVDLLITAEASTYLGQGELSFRLAVRSATFLTHDVHSPRRHLRNHAGGVSRPKQDRPWRGPSPHTTSHQTRGKPRRASRSSRRLDSFGHP